MLTWKTFSCWIHIQSQRLCSFSCGGNTEREHTILYFYYIFIRKQRKSIITLILCIILVFAVIADSIILLLHVPYFPDFAATKHTTVSLHLREYCSISLSTTLVVGTVCMCTACLVILTLIALVQFLLSCQTLFLFHLLLINDLLI